MAFQGHIRLPGSDRFPLPGAVLEGPADPNQQVQVTVFVRRRTDAPGLLDRFNRITLHHSRFSPDQLAARHGADPSDIDRITSLATQNNLQVVSADALSRRVQRNCRRFSAPSSGCTGARLAPTAGGSVRFAFRPRLAMPSRQCSASTTARKPNPTSPYQS